MRVLWKGITESDRLFQIEVQYNLLLLLQEGLNNSEEEPTLTLPSQSRETGQHVAVEIKTCAPVHPLGSWGHAQPIRSREC